MMNQGPRPTFEDGRRVLEAHLFEFDGDLYGEWVRIEWVERLRDVERFASAGQLQQQLERDRSRARAALIAADRSPSRYHPCVSSDRTMSIRTRLLIIAGLIALSIFYLIPRNVTLRERDAQTGVMTDRIEKRVPLKLGLDLQGGMHLALELDQSRQVSADPKRDLELALTVLRKRIDEFGVTEPLIQKVGR